MKSKITSLPICEIEDANEHTIMIQPEINDDGCAIGYLIEGGDGIDLIFSDPDELKQFGQAIIEYAELAQMRLHDKNNKQ